MDVVVLQDLQDAIIGIALGLCLGQPRRVYGGDDAEHARHLLGARAVDGQQLASADCARDEHCVGHIGDWDFCGILSFAADLERSVRA